MLVVSNLPVDPRVRREAQALAEMGWNILIICPLPAGAPPDLDLNWGKGIRIAWLPESAGRFAYRFPCFLGSAMLRAAMRERPFAYHGHDLSTALIALTAARQTGAHAVCDFHEWISENVTYDSATGQYRSHAPLVAATYRGMERFVVRHASATITVGEAIAAELDTLLDGQPRVHVVRNIPSLVERSAKPYATLRATLAIPDSQFLVLYQGGVGPARQLEPVIRALRHAPGIALAIRGPAIEHFADAYRAVAIDAGGGAIERLHILPPVPSSDVLAATKGADAGLYTVADLCRSFSLAMPNKVFEYLQAGLPVLAADYPEVRNLVDGHGLGLLFDPRDPVSIAAAMMRLASDRELARSMTSRIPAALATMNVDREWHRIVEIYDRLAAGGDAAARGPVGRSRTSPHSPSQPAETSA